MEKEITIQRDKLYFVMLNNIKAKHPEWTPAKCNAVATQMRIKVMTK